MTRLLLAALLLPSGTASAGARQLGVSTRADGFFDRLYWTLADGTFKGLDVEG